jgi:hypothetical protein
MSCDWTNPASCAASLITGSVASTVPDAWNAICKAFAQAASELLAGFGKAFAAIPDLNLASAGISTPYAYALALAGVVAGLLVFGQVIRTVWTHDGSGVAQLLTGVAKAVAAWLLTAAVATASIAAANEVTQWIVQGTFGSQAAFSVRLGEIVNWAEVTGEPGQAAVGGSLLLVLAIVGIVLTIVLWFELLLRNAALGVLIAMSPIAAAGQISETTKVWWQRTVSACVQLIILKPVIALVFFVGFSMSGSSRGIEAVLAGLLILLLAVFSWPVIARFFTFATIQASSSGLATALGFVAGRVSAGGGQATGVSPQQWSLGAEQRTMAARDGASGGAGGSESITSAGAGPAASGGTTAPGGPAGGTAASGTGSAVGAGLGWALRTAHGVGTMLAGRMEQTAGHAGMHGAYPYSTMGGGQRPGPARRPQEPHGTSAPASAQSSYAQPDAAYSQPGFAQTAETADEPSGPATPPPAPPADPANLGNPPGTEGHANPGTPEIYGNDMPDEGEQS